MTPAAQVAFTLMPRLVYQIASDLVLVGDRGMITQAQISEDFVSGRRARMASLR